jgi:NDP-sugar pyrophosphorylase family protein
MILAAGLGTRLGDLSSLRPKPMMPVCDVPLVRWALSLLRGHGIKNVIVNTHHLGDLIERELGSEVAYSREQPDILGTGGGIVAAAPFFAGEPFVLVNGKIVVDVDLDAVIAHHKKVGAIATLVVREDAEASKWGAVAVDEARGIVRDIRGLGRHMFTGIHVVEPALLKMLPQSGFSDIVGEGYLPALARSETIGAYVMDGYFWEHSTPERYLLGNFNLLDGVAKPKHAPGPLTGILDGAQVSPHATLREPFLVAPGAIIEAGAVVGPNVIVGRGAKIAAAVRIERAVVWPGVVVDAAAKDIILTGKA